MNFIYLKIVADALSNGVNDAFKSYQSQLYASLGLERDPVYLEQYLQRRGIALGDSDEAQSDSIYAHYPKVPRIERMFLSFVASNRESFKFSGTRLGVVHLTEEEQATLIPEGCWPNLVESEGKTWGDYLLQAESIDDKQYYYMHANYHDAGGGAMQRDSDTNEIEFWAVYDSFDESKILLTYEYLEKL